MFVIERPVPWSMRALAVAHQLWGAVLLAAAAYWGFAALWSVPHMVTGTLVGNLLTAIVLAAGWAGPPGALGVWLGILGRRLWTAQPGIRPAVVRTHLLLLVPGLLMTGVGWYAAHQAARSTEGGIGEPLAYLPLLFGAPMLMLSIASLVVGRSKHREDPVPPPTD